jgi:hypothetical protein
MTDMESANESLSFTFRGKKVLVTHPAVDRVQAQMAIASEPFMTWYQRCEKPQGQKQIEIHSVEIQSVDMFGARYEKTI